MFYLAIIMAGIESQRKFGLARGRNLPFTLESRKGNYQRADLANLVRRSKLETTVAQ